MKRTDLMFLGYGAICLAAIVGCVVTMSIEPSPQWQQQREMQMMRKDIQRERKEAQSRTTQKSVPHDFASAMAAIGHTTSPIITEPISSARLCWTDAQGCGNPDHYCCVPAPWAQRDDEPLALYVACSGPRPDADGKTSYFFREFCPAPWPVMKYGIHMYAAPSAMLEHVPRMLHSPIPGDVFPPGGDGLVDIDDLICTFARFAGDKNTQCIGGVHAVGTDMYPCGGGDGLVDIDDLIAVQGAFAEQAVCP